MLKLFKKKEKQPFFMIKFDFETFDVISVEMFEDIDSTGSLGSNSYYAKHRLLEMDLDREFFIDKKANTIFYVSFEPYTHNTITSLQDEMKRFVPVYNYSFTILDDGLVPRTTKWFVDENGKLLFSSLNEVVPRGFEVFEKFTRHGGSFTQFSNYWNIATYNENYEAILTFAKKEISDYLDEFNKGVKELSNIIKD